MLKLEPMLTRAQIATAFGVSERTILRWVAKGDFPTPIRILGNNRWKESDISGYVKRREAIARQGFAVR